MPALFKNDYLRSFNWSPIMSPKAKPLSSLPMYFLFTEFSLRERRGRELSFEEAFESASLI